MPRKQTIMMGSSLILITYTITLLFAMQVYPAGQTTAALPTTGSIAATEGIGLYSNLACTTPKTSIQWGELQKGGDAEKTGDECQFEKLFLPVYGVCEQEYRGDSGAEDL